MKLTNRQLRQIIKEELESVMGEMNDPFGKEAEQARYNQSNTDVKAAGIELGAGGEGVITFKQNGKLIGSVSPGQEPHYSQAKQAALILKDFNDSQPRAVSLHKIKKELSPEEEKQVQSLWQMASRGYTGPGKSWKDFYVQSNHIRMYLS